MIVYRQYPRFIYRQSRDFVYECGASIISRILVKVPEENKSFFIVLRKKKAKVHKPTSFLFFFCFVFTEKKFVFLYIPMYIKSIYLVYFEYQRSFFSPVASCYRILHRKRRPVVSFLPFLTKIFVSCQVVSRININDINAHQINYLLASMATYGIMAKWHFFGGAIRSFECSAAGRRDGCGYGDASEEPGLCARHIHRGGFHEAAFEGQV